MRNRLACFIWGHKYKLLPDNPEGLNAFRIRERREAVCTTCSDHLILYGDRKDVASFFGGTDMRVPLIYEKQREEI